MILLLAAIAWLVGLAGLHWLDGLFSWFDQTAGDAWRAITAFVHSVINSALDLTSSIFDRVWAWASAMWDQAVAWFVQAINTAWQVFDLAQQFAQNLVTSLWDQVARWLGGLQGWVDNIGAWIINTVNGVLDWISHAPAGILSIASGVANDLWHSVIEPALGLVADTANAAISGLHDLYCGVVDLVNLVYNTVTGILSWIDNTALAIINVCTKALGWLLYFAEHPFSWFTDLFADFARRAPAFLVAHLTDALSKHGSILEDWLARWLEQ